MRSARDFWKDRQIELIAAGLCAAVTAAVVLLGIEPLITEFESQQAQVQQLHARRARDHKLLASRRKLRKSLQTVRSELSESPLHLRSADEVNVRVARLNRIAAQVGARIEEVRLDAPSSFPRFRTVPIHIVGQSRSAGFMNLLGRINQEFPDTAVTRLELLGDGGRGDQPPRFELQLVWYARPGTGQIAAESPNEVSEP